MSSLRQFIVNGRCAEFNNSACQYYVKEKMRRDKIKITKLEEQIGIALNVSRETVHHWIYRQGGPSDMERIIRLANFLDVEDPAFLMTFLDNGGKDMEHLTDRQKTAAKRIYDICIWFLYEFNRTDGFNDYWLDFKESGSEDPESAIYDLVEGMIGKINMVLDQEYFDLRGCDIYDDFCEYVSEDLYGIYDGKLSYGYRFEASANENPTTSQDYDKAMIRLLTIVDKYM